jgi:hypothetical protein
VASANTASNLVTSRDARRSTRISEIVPVIIFRGPGVGDSFLESTSTLAVNCHGCLYPSQNEYQPGSWITLEVPNQQADGKRHSLRAQVKFIRPSRNPSVRYHVGVELQAPANVWGIQLPPEDWLRFPDAAGAATGTELALALDSDVLAPNEQKIRVLPQSSGITPETVSSPTAEVIQQTSDALLGWDKPTRVAPDEIRRTLDAKLLQAAEKAVSLAATSHVNTAVTQAVKAIETFSQSAVRAAEQQCSIYLETLVTSAREQLKDSLTEAQNTARRLEESSSEIHIILAEALDFLKQAARELGKQFSTSLRESATGAAVDFGDKTSRFSDLHLALLAEKVEATTGDAMTRLEGRSAEANAQLDSLNLLATETRTEWEAHRQASRVELSRASEQAIQQFRERMEAIWNSSMVAAMSAVNEHSRSVLDSLSKEPAQQLREACHEPSSR